MPENQGCHLCHPARARLFLTLPPWLFSIRLSRANDPTEWIIIHMKWGGPKNDDADHRNFQMRSRNENDEEHLQKKSKRWSSFTRNAQKSNV